MKLPVKQSPTTWVPIPLAESSVIGYLNSATASFAIPNTLVPSTANSVLVLVRLLCTNFPREKDRWNLPLIKIYTQDENDKQFTKYMDLKPVPDNDYSNSENMWFPITKERKLHVDMSESHYGRYCSCFPVVIGYN